VTCSYCGKPLRKRSWLSFVGTCQCSRLWCRLRSGHLLWWYTGRRLDWRPLLVLRHNWIYLEVCYPVLTKKGVY
jgi:hypothetical protein